MYMNNIWRFEHNSVYPKYKETFLSFKHQEEELLINDWVEGGIPSWTLQLWIVSQNLVLGGLFKTLFL